MATAAQYRVGPSDFFTPGDLEADGDTLNNQVSILDNILSGDQAGKVTQDYWDQFQLWLSSWKSFYSSNLSSYLGAAEASLNDGNRDQLISFETQFGDWANQAKSQGVTLPGSIIVPSTGAKDNLLDQLKNAAGLNNISTGWVLAALVLIAAIVIVPRVLK